MQCCRVCESRELNLVLDLGTTALANRFLTPEMLAEPEPRFPLRLVRCERCGLLQIDETVPPEILFGHYLYLSQTSDAVRQHAERLARGLIDRYSLGPADLVVEAASNDGTVLQAFQRRGLRVLGIEPAANIAELAQAEGVETICEFFNLANAQRIRNDFGGARLVLGRHVLAHVADLAGFVAGMHVLLADNGLAVVEFPHLLPFFQKLEYDQVYHEHLCYFSVRVAQTLFARHGLELIDCEEVPLHGGSVLLTAQHRGGPYHVQPSVADMIAREDAAGLHESRGWSDFARRVDTSRDRLKAEIQQLLQDGKSIAGYGAAAKGMTLLAYCGLDACQLPWIADKSPLKQGRLTPGHHIPVVAPERLLSKQPDVVLLLAWNFAGEIARQQGEYLRRGGRFLIPLPEPHYWMEGP